MAAEVAAEVAAAGRFSRPSNGVAAQDRTSVHSYTAQASDIAEFYNTLPAAAPTSGAATYKGPLVAQMGSGSAYLDGNLELQINLNSGRGSGILDQVSVSGADVVNEPPIALDSLANDISSISNGAFQGSMAGVLNDNPGIFGGSYVLDVDATLNGRFVDNSSQVRAPVSTGLVGTTTGTVTINGSDTRSLNGVFAADEQPASIF